MSDVARLTGLNAEGQPVEWPLLKNSYLIGREAEADIVLPIQRVSRRHALITRQEHGYVLSDLNSRNGTYVNGQLVEQEPVRLKDGDEIVVGGIAAFRFHNPGDTVARPRLGRLKGVWIDEAARAVWVDGRPVDPPLSAAQFTLLLRLYQCPCQVVSQAEIIAAVWPKSDPKGISKEAVEGLIKRLRTRLRETHPAEDYLIIVRGHGVRLMQPSTES